MHCKSLIRFRECWEILKGGEKQKWEKPTGDPRAQAKRCKFWAQCHTKSFPLTVPQFPTADGQHRILFFKQKQQTCRELQPLRKKKNASYASEGPQSGCQQLIPWKTFNITPGKCKYIYFFLQYVQATLHHKLLLWAQNYFPIKNGITLKQPGFHKIFLPVSGWDKNSQIWEHKPRLTMGVMPEELPCLDTAAWYLASLSFMDVSDKRGMSMFFLISAFSGLVSTGYPG